PGDRGRWMEQPGPTEHRERARTFHHGKLGIAGGEQASGGKRVQPAAPRPFIDGDVVPSCLESPRHLAMRGDLVPGGDPEHGSQCGSMAITRSLSTMRRQAYASS